MKPVAKVWFGNHIPNVGLSHSSRLSGERYKPKPNTGSPIDSFSSDLFVVCPTTEDYGRKEYLSAPVKNPVNTPSELHPKGTELQNLV